MLLSLEPESKFFDNSMMLTRSFSLSGGAIDFASLYDNYLMAKCAKVEDSCTQYCVNELTETSLDYCSLSFLLLRVARRLARASLMAGDNQCFQLMAGAACLHCTASLLIK